jgi:hypothetical protein
VIVVITAYFSPCSVSFVLIGEYIQYSPLINFRLIIPSNIHLQLIIPSNIHLQCLCSTKNEKKQHNEGNMALWIISILNRPRNVKNKYVILRHLGDMCLFTSAPRASVNKSHVPSLPQNNLYMYKAEHANKASLIHTKHVFLPDSLFKLYLCPSDT